MNPLDGRSLTASLALHALALAAVFLVLPALRDQTVVYEAVQVHIVSAPAPARPEPDAPPPAPEEELVVETPEDRMEEVEEEAPAPLPEPEPAEPEPEEPEPEEPAPEPEPRSDPPPDDPPPPTEDPAPADSEADEEPEDAGEDIAVRMEGLRRDHPAYHDNIIRQVERCFRSPAASNLEAVVRFVIHADGRVSGIGLSRASGSFVFDRAVEGAVECAGQPGRLGPLPDGYPWDRLPVEFRFSPGGRGGGAQEDQPNGGEMPC